MNNKYHFELYTPKNILFSEFNNFNEAFINISNKILLYKNCTLVITNNETKKRYDPISMEEICSLFNKNFNFDETVLTTYNISEETEESTNVPIELLYSLAGRMRHRLYRKYKSEVVANIEYDLEQRSIMARSAEEPIVLLKDLPSMYQNKLRMLGYQDDDNVLEFNNYKEDNEQLFQYVQTFEETLFTEEKKNK